MGERRIYPPGVEGEAVEIMVALKGLLGREPTQDEFKAEARKMGWHEGKLFELHAILEAKGKG